MKYESLAIAVALIGLIAVLKITADTRVARALERIATVAEKK